MANLTGLVGIVAELRQERTTLVGQLKQIDSALSALGSLNGGSSALGTSTGKRIVSAAARRKMSLAQKARWGNRNASNSLSVVKPKRVMSASARRKIAAAQRARWAKIRAVKKAA